MKAHKELEWEAHMVPHGIFYTADGYILDQYRLGRRTVWRVEGHGLEIIHSDIDALRLRVQEHYNRTRQLKAWEDYMLTHEPPEETE